MPMHTLNPVYFFAALETDQDWRDAAARTATVLTGLSDDDQEAEIVALVADADADVRDNLLNDLEAASGPEERHLLNQLLTGRHVWLDAHFRDQVAGATTPHPACAMADRLWASVAVERRINAF